MNRKPIILAVETSSRIGSVALGLGDRLLGESTFSASLRHSAEIFPAIADLLARSDRTPTDIDHVYISIGPGSFTGLRIAVAAAKSVHLAVSAHIVTVNSLDAIAANVSDAAVASMIQNSAAPPFTASRLATVLDAKRSQFYIAVYEWAASNAPVSFGPAPENPGYRIPAPQQGHWRKVQPDCLMSASECIDRFTPQNTPLYVVGDGLLHHRDKFQAKGLQILDQALWSPHAVQVHTLGHQKARTGRFADPLTLVPFYLRGPQVTLRKNAAPPPADDSHPGNT